MEYAEKELNIVRFEMEESTRGKDLTSIFNALAVLNNSVEHPLSDSDDE